MSGAEPAVVRVVAPAKINLGLAVVGQRPDGFHELVTIFQAVEPSDRLEVGPPPAGIAPPALVLETDDPDLNHEDNLAFRALAALRDTMRPARGATLRLRKRIPVAAGLGGASSDAAAALLAGRAYWQPASDERVLAALAADLGSDVPFFLRGGTALGTGRGEIVDPLPTPADRWAVIVSPAIVIPRKTPTLYAALVPADRTNGGAVHAQANRLRAGLPPDPALLGNAFARALYALVPDLADLPAILRRRGAAHVALSGAGPSHYTLTDDPDRAAALAAAFAASLGAHVRVAVSSLLATRLEPVRVAIGSGTEQRSQTRSPGSGGARSSPAQPAGPPP